MGFFPTVDDAIDERTTSPRLNTYPFMNLTLLQLEYILKDSVKSEHPPRERRTGSTNPILQELVYMSKLKDIKHSAIAVARRGNMYADFRWRRGGMRTCMDRMSTQQCGESQTSL